LAATDARGLWSTRDGHGATAQAASDSGLGSSLDYVPLRNSKSSEGLLAGLVAEIVVGAAAIGEDWPAAGVSNSAASTVERGGL